MREGDTRLDLIEIVQYTGRCEAGFVTLRNFT